MTDESLGSDLPKESYEDLLQNQFDEPIRIGEIEKPEDFYRLIEKFCLYIERFLQENNNENEEELLKLKEVVEAKKDHIKEIEDFYNKQISNIKFALNRLWRIRQGINSNENLEDLGGLFNRIEKHIDVIIDEFENSGFQIKDHTNDIYDPGMSISVLAYESMKGLKKERVIETINPSIYYQDSLIQLGDVIIGTPEKTQD